MPDWLEIVGMVVVILGAIVGAGYGLIKVGEWKGGVDSHQTAFTALAAEIKDKLDEILSRLDPSPTSASSPTTLTDLGHRISERIKAKECVESIFHLFNREARDKQPYEIQQSALAFAKDDALWSEDELNGFRQCAYDEGISIDAVHEVLGIELRDRYIKEVTQDE